MNSNLQRKIDYAGRFLAVSGGILAVTKIIQINGKIHIGTLLIGIALILFARYYN